MENEEENKVEPYGAQILRKLHGDHLRIMKDYDGMAGQLEQEDVKSHLEGHLQGVEKFLSNTEKMFGKHYKDLPGLEGMEEENEEVGKEGEKNLKMRTKGKSDDYGIGTELQRAIYSILNQKAGREVPLDYVLSQLTGADRTEVLNAARDHPKIQVRTRTDSPTLLKVKNLEESLKKSFTQQKETLEKLNKKLNELASKVKGGRPDEGPWVKLHGDWIPERTAEGELRQIESELHRALGDKYTGENRTSREIEWTWKSSWQEEIPQRVTDIARRFGLDVYSGRVRLQRSEGQFNP